MNRILRRGELQESSPSAPSTAWLFAQAISDKPLPHPARAQAEVQPAREQLEWLARVLARRQEALQKLQSAEAEARHDREQLDWLAEISDEHESQRRMLLRKEVAANRSQARHNRYCEAYSANIAEWNETDHPRRGYGPHPGAWIDKGTGGGSSGTTGRSTPPSDSNRNSNSVANPHMLELAHTWWRTKGAIEQARRDIEELPGRIESERAQLGRGGRYAYIHTQNLAKAQRDLETAKALVMKLEQQLRDLDRQYRDSGYEELQYSTWTPGETLVGGKGIEQVGRAVANGGSPAGLKPTGIEFDVVSAALAGPAILGLGKAVLGTALRKVPVPKPQRALFGQATSSNYRKTFFDANPIQEGNVVVHHAVEQQVLGKYPSVITESELHSLENLRGIPKGVNAETHLREIRKEWNAFYKQHPSATREQLLDKATELDHKYGHVFDPPIR